MPTMIVNTLTSGIFSLLNSFTKSSLILVDSVQETIIKQSVRKPMKRLSFSKTKKYKNFHHQQFVRVIISRSIFS